MSGRWPCQLAPRFRPLLRGLPLPARGRDDLGRLPPISMVWYPSVGIELGSIRDAGGNEALEQRIDALGDGYTRIAARAAIVLLPAIVSEGLRLRAQHTYRRDLTADQDRHLWEFLATQDVHRTGRLQLTAAFKRGVTPPLFKRVDRLILGLGVKL